MNKIQSFMRHELRHALKKAEPSIFEDVLQFLVDDSREFGSGYLKEMIWRYITRYPLKPKDIERLEFAALKYLERPMTPEFKRMCFAMARIATPAFWEIVKSKLDTENPRVKVNAACLYPYSNGLNSGEKNRQEWKSILLRWWVEELRRQNYYTVEQLIEILRDTVHWVNGRVVFKSPDENDLPITYIYEKKDLEIASFDWQFCVPELVLPKLQVVLSKGSLNYRTLDTWLYTIYVLRQLNDARSIPILAHFLEEKIDWRYPSHKKHQLVDAVIKTLKHLGTIEAMQVVAHYEKIGL